MPILFQDTRKWHSTTTHNTKKSISRNCPGLNTKPLSSGQILFNARCVDDTESIGITTLNLENAKGNHTIPLCRPAWRNGQCRRGLISWASFGSTVSELSLSLSAETSSVSTCCSGSECKVAGLTEQLHHELCSSRAVFSLNLVVITGLHDTEVSMNISTYLLFMRPAAVAWGAMSRGYGVSVPLLFQAGPSF